MVERSPAAIQYRKRMLIFWATMAFGGLVMVGSAVGLVVFFATFSFDKFRPVGYEPVEWTVDGQRLVMPGPTVGPEGRAVLLDLSDVTGERIEDFDPRYSQSWNPGRGAAGEHLNYIGYGLLDSRLVVMSSAWVPRPGSDTYVAARLGPAENAVTSRGLEAEPRPGLVTWGDETVLELLRDKGQPAGFRFRARSGEKRFTALVIGIPYEDPGRLEALLRPCLEALDAYPR